MAKVASSMKNIAYLPFAECAVPYYIRFSTRARRLQMRIKEKKLEVIVPMGTSHQLIMAFIDKNRLWAKEQYIASENNKNLFWPEKFQAGEEVIIQGAPKRLDLKLSDGCLAYVCQQRLVVGIDKNTSISQLDTCIQAKVVDYLKILAQEKVEEYAHKISNKLNRWPRSVRVREVHSRWGSCGIHQDIYINWLLILAPQQVLMYVVIHECCHLFYRNHGVRFWQKVESLMPGYRKAEQWLRHYGMHLAIPK